MKTNKDERNAISSKFYNRMEEQVPVKQAELEKSSLYKEASKLSKEINKLNKAKSDLKRKLEVMICNHNQKNKSSFFRVKQHSSYGSENEGSLYISMDSSWSVIPELNNAILIAQVGTETVADLMKVLEQEVKL